MRRDVIVSDESNFNGDATLSLPVEHIVAFVDRPNRHNVSPHVSQLRRASQT